MERCFGDALKRRSGEREEQIVSIPREGSLLGRSGVSIMRATVRFFGPVRSLVRKKEQVILLEEGATVRSLLDELARSNGSEFRRYVVIEGSTINPALVVFLNGESLDEIMNLDAPIPPAPTIDVMLASAVLGG